MNNITKWMSWQGGVDLAAGYEGKEGSMILVHVAAMVHTPVGSAPSGMVLLQENAGEAPSLMGFISTKQEVADYFGPNVFAGTPFENAPGLVADIEVSQSVDSCSARVVVNGTELSVTMDNLAGAKRVSREANENAPFAQQVLERAAGNTSLTVNGESIAIAIPPQGASGEPVSAFTPAGIYSR